MIGHISSASTQLRGISRMAEPISGVFTRRRFCLYRLAEADRPPSGDGKERDQGAKQWPGQRHCSVRFPPST